MKVDGLAQFLVHGVGLVHAVAAGEGEKAARHRVQGDCRWTQHRHQRPRGPREHHGHAIGASRRIGIGQHEAEEGENCNQRQCNEACLQRWQMMEQQEGGKTTCHARCQQLGERQRTHGAIFVGQQPQCASCAMDAALL